MQSYPPANTRWLLAKRRSPYTIRGIDLNTALQEAKEALKILKHLESTRGNTSSLGFLSASDSEDHVLDTIGYIELQLGRKYDAAKTYKQIKWSERSQSGWKYRFAIALTRLGKNPEAKRYFDEATAEKYVPTHELLLAPVTPTN